MRVMPESRKAGRPEGEKAGLRECPKVKRRRGRGSAVQKSRKGIMWKNKKKQCEQAKKE